MSAFSTLLSTGSKTLFITSCDTYSGYKLACHLHKHLSAKGTCVVAGYFHENELVRDLAKRNIRTTRICISDLAHMRAEFDNCCAVMIVPPVTDDHWANAKAMVKCAGESSAKGLMLMSMVGIHCASSIPALKPLCEMEDMMNEMKGKFECVSLVRCSVHLDLMWLFRKQIAMHKRLEMACEPGAKFAPLVVKDGVKAICEIMERHECDVYEFTGMKKVDMMGVVRDAAEVLGVGIEFAKVDAKKMIEYLKSEGVCENYACFIAGMCEAVSKGCMDVQCNTLKDLLGKDPMCVVDYFKKNENDFAPKK